LWVEWYNFDGDWDFHTHREHHRHHASKSYADEKKPPELASPGPKPRLRWVT
jgi:hypothetical protein